MSSSLVGGVGPVFVAVSGGVISRWDEFGGIVGRSGSCSVGFSFERLSQDRKVGLGGFGGVEYTPPPPMSLVPPHSNVRVL